MKLLSNKFLKENHKSGYTERLIRDGESRKTYIDYSFNEVADSTDYLFLRSEELNKEKTNKYKSIYLGVTADSRMPILTYFQKGTKKLAHYKKIVDSLIQPHFSGIIVKQVSGGFVLELNGFLCFMPFSLSEIRKGAVHQQILNQVQLFYRNRVMLTIGTNPEHGYSFNVVISKKQSLPYLKKLFKVFNKIITIKGEFSIKKKSKINLNNKKIRVFLQLGTKKSSFICKGVKELILSSNK